MKYIEEEIKLLNRLLLISAAIEGNGEIIKTASIVDNIKNILSDASGAVKDRVEREGLTPTLINYIIASMLPMKLKIFVPLLDMVGINIFDILKTAASFIIGTIQNNDGKAYSQEDADNDLSRFMGQVKVTSSLNDFALKKYSEDGELHLLFKQAKPKVGPKSQNSSNPLVFLYQMLKSNEKGSLLKNIIKLLFKVLAAGFIGAAITEAPTLLKSTYENAVVPVANSVGGNDDEDNKEYKDTHVSSLPTAIQHNLKPSGRGQESHVNSGNTNWYVKLIDDNIPKTLIYWSENVYPELKGYSKEIASTDSFNKLLSIMSKTFNTDELPYYVMPQNDQLHTIKDVVDLFAGEAAEEINKKG